MIRCPDCQMKLRTYCTKHKAGETFRYYKCPICGKTIITKVFKYEKIVKEKAATDQDNYP